MKKKNLFLAILFSLPLLSSGQSFGQFITNDTVLKIICQKLPDYDSLLLYSYSSFWTPRTRMKGVAYEGVNRYLFCIEFSFPLTIENNKHPFFSKVIFKRKLPEVLSSDVRMGFNQDSLEVYTCGEGNIILVSSHDETSTILKLYPKQMRHVHWQAYNAEMHQSHCPNEDRAKFIALINILSKLVPIDIVCEVKRDFFIIEP